jgi:Ca2+-binding RTX toxin-like protein
MALFGTARNDTLTAGVGGTRLIGGVGNDQLIGGEGNDVLIGGSHGKGALGKSVVSLSAYADMLQGEGAKFKVLVNGHLVGQGEAKGGTEAWDASEFAFTFKTPKAFHTLEVQFLNDGSGGGHDRNLYVNAINFNGVDVNLESANNGQSPHTGTLYANGEFSIDLAAFFKTIVPVKSDNDILDGGFGNDILTGGYGKDVFGFATGYGKDEITDFGKGDSIYIANWKAIHDFADVKKHASNHGDDVWITAGHDTLIIDHFAKAVLRAADFQF